MKKEKLQTGLLILKKLADLLGTKIKNGRLNIPKKFGNGYCNGFVFNEHIQMLIMNYELKKNLVLKNPGIDASKKMILFKFQNSIPKAGIVSKRKQIKAMPSVLITTSSMNTDTVIPIHTNTGSINIEVDANYLKGLFDVSKKSTILQSLLQNSKPLLFEQMMFPSLQKIADEIMLVPLDETFKLFFMRVKAEELICRLLMELEKRNEKQLYALNNHDIQTIYKVKEQMLKQLQSPPVINDLAALAGMSATKLKRLFRQIFGNSIFNYYQEFRMKEAALLLKEEKLSVSEAGYQLGFTNLSHFSRVFKEHIGMKPKQYSMV